MPQAFNTENTIVMIYFIRAKFLHQRVFTKPLYYFLFIKKETKKESEFTAFSQEKTMSEVTWQSEPLP